MGFRQLDLNLLRVLCAVYRCGSVTEAGRQLSLSQPATSNALARLRRYFDDALFVRSPAGLHPTDLAQRIAPKVMAHLQALEMSLASDARFEPGQARVHWRLSLSDLGEMMFLPPLAQLLRRESPHCLISNVAVDADQVSAALEAREIDLAIGILRPEHSGIASERLFHESFVAITGSTWRPSSSRRTRTLSAQELAQASLAVSAPTATSHRSVELMLARLKLSNRAVVRVRHYGALPELVTGTDLMAIVPMMFAHSLAPRFDVRIWDLPGQGAPYDVSMAWHQSARKDPAQVWLRDQVRALFARDGIATAQ